MGLLSLERYLYAGQPQIESNSAETEPPNYLDFATRTLSSIRRSVLTGESLHDLSENVELIRRTLQIESSEKCISECANQMEGLLESFQQRNREQGQQQAAEIHNLLDLLNETFVHFHAGTEKSAERLKELETGLGRAAKIDDIAALRAQVSKMLDYVRAEGARDQHEDQKTLENLGQQIRDAHTVSRPQTKLSGKADALEYLACLRRGESSNPHAALFVVDSLRAIRVRHGDELANTILRDAATKSIAPLTPGGKAFCWSPISILLVWDHAGSETAPADILNRLPTALQQRAFIGTRIATFSLAVRFMVVPAAAPVDEIVSALDRFAKAGPAC